MKRSSIHSPRRVIYFSLALFALSMLVPSYRIFTDFAPGYAVAWSVEQNFWVASWNFVRAGTGFTTAFNLSEGDLIMLVGATANHFFVLACMAALMNWRRTAAACSIVSSLCAVGCLLPGQIREFDRAWFLGPGYFVWCAAHSILAIAMVRAVHRAIRSHSEPLFAGLLTSPARRVPDNPAA